MYVYKKNSECRSFLPLSFEVNSCSGACRCAYSDNRSSPAWKRPAPWWKRTWLWGFDQYFEISDLSHLAVLNLGMNAAVSSSLMITVCPFADHYDQDAETRSSLASECSSIYWSFRQYDQWVRDAFRPSGDEGSLRQAPSPARSMDPLKSQKVYRFLIRADYERFIWGENEKIAVDNKVIMHPQAWEGESLAFVILMILRLSCMAMQAKSNII